MTLREWIVELRPFARWIDDRAAAEISAVTSSDLDAYLMHVRPSDPLKNVHPARFRRTLAYFIVRRPRGLI